MTTPSVDTTMFAPAGRASPDIVRAQSRLLSDVRMPQALCDTAPGIVMVLNRQRQIVFHNAQLARLLGVTDPSLVHGQRPGEVLGCLHAHDHPGGCGTGEHCSACGAVLAILVAQAGREDAQECRVLRGPQKDALDLLVRALPLSVAGEPFTIVTAVDIGHEKRRRALERVFFHDVLNTATGLQMQAHALAARPGNASADLAAGIENGIARLVEEIASHRDLMAAESRDLAVRPIEINSRDMLDEVARSCRPHAALQGCRLQIAVESADLAFQTDVALLARVLGNMTKNAIEASSPSQPVTLGCRDDDDGVLFWVHNHGFIPRPVQLQIFMRSFSTKGPGRGLGTYSMQLLTERYLKGRVGFSSCPREGTTFHAWYPLELSNQ